MSPSSPLLHSRASSSRSPSPQVRDFGDKDLDDLEASLDDARRTRPSSRNSYEDPPYPSPSLRTPPPPYLEKLASTGSRHAPNWLRRPRPRAIGVVILLAILSLFGLGAVMKSDSVDLSHFSSYSFGSSSSSSSSASKSTYPAEVQGAPTRSFRDNMRNDTKYVTTWINAGWTNDVMTYINLIYLAQMTGRTAVLPPFAPSHVGHDAPVIPVSEVFDIERMREETGVPIIEWRDLKQLEQPADFNLGVSINEGEAPPVVWAPREEVLGCWSIWATASPVQNDAQTPNREPRPNPLAPHLALDVAYTRVPGGAVLYPQFANDPHVKFWELALLGFPSGREAAHLPQPVSEGGPGAHFPAPHSGERELPEDQMMCFDFMYYVSEQRTYEFWYEWSPAWRFVGTHWHWAPRIEELAKSMIRATFGLQPKEAIPPFVSMHIRHGDFKQYCQTGQDCFAPLSVLAGLVDQVREETYRKTGVMAEKVLLTSDEKDPEWWAGVKGLGWEWVDHEALKTVETYGIWYPVFIDAIIQSLGDAFVGTDKSTMSLLAQRRVEDWQGGAGTLVQWFPQ